MILSIRDLTVSYGPIQVLHGISLEVREGEIVTIIGANGAGKTTLLRAISGLARAEGQIHFAGESILRKRPHEIARRGISHVPERRGIFANLTVLENLKVGAFNRRITPADFDEVYELFPRIRERQQQIAGTLSGGEQQMLAISRALLARPKLLLLDEPSLGLAPQITQSIFQTIRTINSSGTTVLLIEQNAHAALRIASRGYCLEVGAVAFHGEAKTLLSDDTVRKAYLGELG